MGCAMAHTWPCSLLFTSLVTLLGVPLVLVKRILRKEVQFNRVINGLREVVARVRFVQDGMVVAKELAAFVT